MATIMEKDVLLEYASIGYLVYQLPQTDEIKQILRLWGFYGVKLCKPTNKILTMNLR